MDKQQLIDTLTAALEVLTAPVPPTDARITLLAEADIGYNELRDLIANREALNGVGENMARLGKMDCIDSIVDNADSFDQIARNLRVDQINELAGTTEDDLNSLLNIRDMANSDQLEDLANNDLGEICALMEDNGWDTGEIRSNLEKVEEIDSTLDEIRNICDNLI